MIKWTKTRDRHQEGRWSHGRTWIRQDREGRVTGMYWQTRGQTGKRVPQSEEEETPAGARLILQILVETLEAGGSRI